MRFTIGYQDERGHRSNLSFCKHLLHSAVFVDVAILLYLNVYLKHETMAPFFLLVPWITARIARNHFIKAYKRNLNEREKRILFSSSLTSWSLLCYGLRFWFATSYLGWVDLLVCILVFITTYPFGRFLHLGLLKWAMRDVNEEQLAYLIGLPALPKDYIAQRDQSPI